MVGISHSTHLLLSLNTHCSVGSQLDFFSPSLKLCSEMMIFYLMAVSLNTLSADTITGAFGIDEAGCCST